MDAPAYACVDAGHLGYIGVYTNGSAQYTNADITGTNWLGGATTNHTMASVSVYARAK